MKIFKIYKMELMNNGVYFHPSYIGRATTPIKAMERVKSYVAAYNGSILRDDPEASHVHTHGDINEQIENGSVRAYVYDDDMPWVNLVVKKCDEIRPHCHDVEMQYDISLAYAYHRRGITTDIWLKNNCDIVEIPSGNKMIFYWTEVEEDRI